MPPSSSPSKAGAAKQAKKKVNPADQLKPATSARPLIKHVGFTDNATGAKVNSNKIHDVGELKPVACTNCIGALAEADPKKTTGRGVKNYNEYFCCMVYKGLGVGGEQCGRCVGLGRGDTCVDPPLAAKNESRAVIAHAPDYNRVVKRYEGKPATLVKTAAEIEIITKAANLSKTFNEVLGGLRSRGEIEKTPSSKRKADALNDDENPTKLLKQTDRNQELIQSKLDTLINHAAEMSVKLDEVTRQNAILERRSWAARARERWLTEAVFGLIRQGNDRVNPAGGQPGTIETEEFNLDITDVATDNGVSDESFED